MRFDSRRASHPGPVATMRGRVRAASVDVSGPSVRGAAARWFGRCFYACGDEGPPRQISCLGVQYELKRVLKHDFVAATGLYEATHPRPDLPGKLIGKTNRRQHFCLVPLHWLGRLVTHKEVCNLRRCDGIREVPAVLARPHANTYVYAYIEGTDLGERPALPQDLFDRLAAAVRQIHARNLVHFDLHKPGNILVDRAGRPHIIDFQLSLHLGDRCLLSRWLSTRFRRRLQTYDIYHVYKHKRRLQPQLLTEAERQLSQDHSLPLRIHRAVAKPYKRIRRACLRYLHAKGILTGGGVTETHGETTPSRWAGN